MNESTGAGDLLGRTDFLSRSVKAGASESFPELFQRVSPALYAWLHLRLHGRNGGTEVQDLLQEVWLRALQSFPNYDATRSFRGWILGIAKNVLLQHFERRGREPLVGQQPPSDGDGGSPEIADSVTSVSLRLAKDDVLQRFLAYVNDLVDEERALLLYCGLEEYTCAEAAARLGISSDAATKRWQALRARLRQNGVLQALASDLG